MRTQKKTSPLTIRVESERKRLALIKARKRGKTLTSIVEDALEAFINEPVVVEPVERPKKYNICDHCEQRFEVTSRLQRVCSRCRTDG